MDQDILKLALGRTYSLDLRSLDLLIPAQSPESQITHFRRRCVWGLSELKKNLYTWASPSCSFAVEWSVRWTV